MSLDYTHRTPEFAAEYNWGPISLPWTNTLRFKGSKINWALPSLHGGSLKITFTVPLFYTIYNV